MNDFEKAFLNIEHIQFQAYSLKLYLFSSPTLVTLFVLTFILAFAVLEDDKERKYNHQLVFRNHSVSFAYQYRPCSTIKGFVTGYASDEKSFRVPPV